VIDLLGRKTKGAPAVRRARVVVISSGCDFAEASPLDTSLDDLLVGHAAN
jgi:hypothetical protein